MITTLDKDDNWKPSRQPTAKTRKGFLCTLCAGRNSLYTGNFADSSYVQSPSSFRYHVSTHLNVPTRARLPLVPPIFPSPDQIKPLPKLSLPGSAYHPAYEYPRRIPMNCGHRIVVVGHVGPRPAMPSRAATMASSSIHWHLISASYFSTRATMTPGTKGSGLFCTWRLWRSRF